jgi:hypothetical protein
LTGRRRAHIILEVIKLIIHASAILILLACPAFASREQELPANPDFDYIKVSGGPWITSGMGRWQTSFPLAPGISKADFGFGSTLEFQDPADLLWLWNVEVRPIQRLSFEFQYADSARITGEGRDHDWLDAPNGIVTVQPSGNVYVNPRQTDMSTSQSTLSGRTTFVSANMYGRILQYDNHDAGITHQYLDVLLGYSWYDDRFRMKNLVQLTSTGDIISTPPPGYYPGLDSTFHFHWEGFKIGMREDTGMSEHLRATGLFAFSPFMSYRGDGYWNLRSDFRPAPPSFTQSASGALFEGKFSMIYDPFRYFSVEAGYMIVYFRTNPGGQMTAYLSDGTSVTQDLDSAWSERKGFLLNLALKF